MTHEYEQPASVQTHDQISLEQDTIPQDTAQEPSGFDRSPSTAISAPEISILALNNTGETRYLGPSSGVPLVSLERNTNPQELHQELSRDDHSFTAAISAPEISILALNATGETRDLGPLSGVPLASHAAAIASSSVSNGSSTQNNVSAFLGSRRQSRLAVVLADQDTIKDQAEVDVLVRSYQTWIQPLYPLFEMETLYASMHSNREQEAAGNMGSNLTSNRKLQMAEYYLVLALGAIHHGRSTDQCREDVEELRSQAGLRRDPARLYLKSLEYLDIFSGDFHPSIPLIRVILLMCIYGFNGKVGYSQWRMAGSAMRVGFAILDSSDKLMISDGH